MRRTWSGLVISTSTRTSSRSSTCCPTPTRRAPSTAPCRCAGHWRSPHPKRGRWSMRAEERSGWLLAVPYTAFLAVFAFYPIAFALVLVFLKWDLVTPPSFAGLDNVRLLVVDGRFWQAVA